MKALVFLGIHNNITALEAVWERERDCDVIQAAGDCVDYGQRVQFKVFIAPPLL